MSHSHLHALQGFLVGEALGRPFHGLKPGHVEQLLGGERPEGFLADPRIQPERPDRNVLPGLHGVAGQQLLAMLAAGFDDGSGRGPVAAAGAQLQQLADDGAAGDDEDFGLLRAPGRPLRRAVARWRRDYPWEAADWLAPDEPSQGLTPIVAGIAAFSLNGSATAAIDMARLTHTHCLAIGAALAVRETLLLVSESIGARRFPAVEIAEQLITRLHPLEKAHAESQKRHWREIGWGSPIRMMSDFLAPIPSLLREGRDDLAIKTLLTTAAQHQPEGQQPSHVQHGFAGISLPWALYRALGSQPPRVAVEDLLVRGGECGLVTGLVLAIRLVRHGEEVLPDEWRHGTRALPVAAELLAAPALPAFDRWLAAERSWNADEASMRAPLIAALRKQQALEAEREKAKPKKARPVDQTEARFAPPPHLWLKPGEEEDPKKKKILRALRGKKRIDWKEERDRGDG